MLKHIVAYSTLAGCAQPPNKVLTKTATYKIVDASHVTFTPDKPLANRPPNATAEYHVVGNHLTTKFSNNKKISELEYEKIE